MRIPGGYDLQPTRVDVSSDEATPTAASTKEVLRQAPSPPAITARLCRTSQKVLTWGQTGFDHGNTASQLVQPVTVTSNPARSAATIRRHASLSIIGNPYPRTVVSPSLRPGGQLAAAQ